MGDVCFGTKCVIRIVYIGFSGKHFLNKELGGRNVLRKIAQIQHSVLPIKINRKYITTNLSLRMKTVRQVSKLVHTHEAPDFLFISESCGSEPNLGK